MTIEHHSLVHEFPQFKEDIHHLKLSDAHFRKLWGEYNHLTNEIEKMEQEIIPSTTFEEEKLKKQRLQLKDVLFGYLKKESQEQVTLQAL